MLHRLGYGLILLPTLAAISDLTCTPAREALKKTNETLRTVSETARWKENTFDGDLARQRLLFSQVKDCVSTAASVEAARWCSPQ